MPKGALHEMNRLFAGQKDAFANEMLSSEASRRDRLERLEQAIAKHSENILAAISADFGHRSHHEMRLAELHVTQAEIVHAKRLLAKWMKPGRVGTTLAFFPGRNRLIRQPLGVVGVISPWNYPLQLALCPAIGAIAAGNRVMIKPSELTPRFSSLLDWIVSEYFSPDEMAVVLGGVDVAEGFSRIPFDHLFFTGSSTVGKRVAMAAAENLTPVTLELGGKSPAVLDSSCDLSAAVPRLIFAKLFNAGQTCVAPDYVLVPHHMVDAFIKNALECIRQMYGNIENCQDYTSIVSERHYLRLCDLVWDAKKKGATVVPSIDKRVRQMHQRQFPPTLLLDVTPDMHVCQEEIFGPLLPVIQYGEFRNALRYINSREKPLALYWFGTDRSRRDEILLSTLSGGVTINDCLWHVGQPGQPFGGVGGSGLGEYHGEWGFRTFSKEKPVFYQARFSGTDLLRPPYGHMFDRMMSIARWAA